VVCLLAREQGGPDLCCQLLIYPATDMLMRYPSHLICGDDYRLPRTSIAWFVNGYLRDGEDIYDLRASPLMVENHHDLPPPFVMTAGFAP
jgi:acetyl esterase